MDNYDEEDNYRDRRRKRKNPRGKRPKTVIRKFLRGEDRHGFCAEPHQ